VIEPVDEQRHLWRRVLGYPATNSVRREGGRISTAVPASIRNLMASEMARQNASQIES
jgi:hypothetical protein